MTPHGAARRPCRCRWTSILPRDEKNLVGAVDDLDGEVFERVARGRGRQVLADRLDGEFRLDDRQVERLLDGVRLPHDVHGGIDVPRQREPPRDERLEHAGVLARREQRRRRREALAEVVEGGFAERAVGLAEVEDVVDELEGEPDVAAVPERRVGNGPTHTFRRIPSVCEHGGRAARVGHERSRFVEVLREIRRQAVLAVDEPGAHLRDFAAHEVLDDGREDFDDVQVSQARQGDARAREEKVARENRHFVAELGVPRRDAPPRRGAVDDVVVEQRGGVDHLDDLGETLLPRKRRFVADRLGDEEHHGAAEFLAAVEREEVARRRRQQRVVRLHEVEHAAAQLRRLVAHQSEGVGEVGTTCGRQNRAARPSLKFGLELR
mmetsp:Transcript_3741/g.14674  ORF Transcript_3741/g.14674 Transcript_3741/m.14674 type:complete len:380 (-) Transcript_3741:182-1321(-)